MELTPLADTELVHIHSRCTRILNATCKESRKIRAWSAASRTGYVSMRSWRGNPGWLLFLSCTLDDYHLFDPETAGLLRRSGPTVLRRNSIRVSCGHLFQPVLVMQSPENSLIPDDEARRKTAALSSRWRGLPNRLRNARPEG